MAVNVNKQARRLTVMALAISAFTLPAMASADPDNGGRGEWRTRSDAGGRQERSDEPINAGVGGNGGWRARQAPQQQEQPREAPAPAPQAAPQAQANWQARADRGDRGNRGGDQGGERRNWNGAQDAPRAAPAPAPQPPQQAGWNGGNRQGQDPRQGQAGTWNGGNRDQGNRPAPDQGRTWSRDGNRDGNRDGYRDGNRDGQARNWTGAGQPNHDGDRRQHDARRTRDRNGGYVQGGYVQGGTTYGNTTGYNRDGYNRDRHHDGTRDGRQWNRQWRSNTSYNWYSYRSSHPSYYRLGNYYAPYRNYSYRRLSVGFFLEQLFFGQNYQISNPQYYRLPEVYGPYRWVRYYDDAVLVDIYSGEVVDVINNFFW